MSEEKLSVRLEMHAKVASSRAHWVGVNGEADEGFWNAFAADLDAAAQLARRVEEAPVGDIWQHAYIDGQHTSRIRITRQPGDGLEVIGQRVRLVREQEP